jgi:hypothetical protein
VRRGSLAVGVVVIVLVLVEVLAVPLATRVVGAVVARCVTYESLEVTSVARPVVPRLLLGRARDVELRATEVVVGDVRLSEVSLWLPNAVLPWAVGDPEPSRGELTLGIDQADLERTVRAVSPLDLPVELDLRPGVATLGTPWLPVTVDLEVEVEPDGTVRVRPVRGGALLERLGIGRSFPPREELRFTTVRIEADQVRGTADVAVVPGGGDGGCGTPLAAEVRP